MTLRDLHALLGIGAAALTLTSADRTSAHAQSETEARNKAIVGRSFEAWGTGTGSPFDLLADDARWTIEGNSVASKTYPNKEAFLAEVIRPFNARLQVGLTAGRTSAIRYREFRGERRLCRRQRA